MVKKDSKEKPGIVKKETETKLKQTEESKIVKPKEEPKKEIKLEPKAEIKPKGEEKPKETKEKPTPKKEVKLEVKEKPAPKKVDVAPEQPKTIKFKAFGLWDTNIQVLDPGLKRYMCLNPYLVPFTYGRFTEKQFWKSKKPIIERLINKIMVSGHKGKKHFRTSGGFSGKKNIAFKNVKEAFKIVEKKTGKNPVEVFVRAVENGAPKEGVTTVEYGGNKYTKAVDLSPQRRIDLVLRWMSQGAFHTSARSKGRKPISYALAEQIILTYEEDGKSNCIAKRIDLERTSSSSR